MNFAKQTILRISLSLALALSLVSGDVAQADPPSPLPVSNPPAATSVALNTYGSLPVVVLNLTQSPINFNISTNSTNYGSALPLAAGLPGVYYPQSNGATTTFNNIVNPGAAVNGTTTASLMPAVTSVTPSTATTYDITVNNNYDWMSLFTVFPSWSKPASYSNVQFVAMNKFEVIAGTPGAPLGAAAYSFNALAGYPRSDAKDSTAKNYYTTANVLNAGSPVTTSINLNLLPAGGQAATYKININSLGGSTSGKVPTGANGWSILGMMHSVLDVVTDVATIASGDPLGIIDYIAGIPATIDGIVSDVQNGSANANITTDTNYPAKSAGINVSATATFSDTNGEKLVAYEGDSQSLIYEVQGADGTYAKLPLIQQNAVIITTWRQKPADNYGVELNVNSADTLFVTVLNNGVYASNQVQKYINQPSTAFMSNAAKYKPTKAQATDSLKILGILTALAKNNPQDANYIVEMFGIRGKYDKMKHDPNAVKTMHQELKAIFEKHSKSLPAIEPYLSKLAQK
jgi:hypothetical protein